MDERTIKFTLLDLQMLESVCSEEQMERLMAEASDSRMKKGQILFSEGSNPLGVYLVKSGKVKITKETDGREHIQRLAIEGAILGTPCVVSERPHPFSAQALEDSEITVIPKMVFLQLMRENSKLTTLIMNTLCAEIEESYDDIVHLAHQPVRARLAQVLITLHKVFATSNGQDGQENSDDVMINISRENIANMIGSVRETVFRYLRDFEEDGLINLSDRKILIRNLPGLKKISES